MRRKSEKGFMLLETLVVTVFIATLFAFIYQNTIPLFGEYKQRMKYDDIDSVEMILLIFIKILQIVGRMWLASTMKMMICVKH